MSTLKSLLPQAFAVSNVHPRPRKHFSRCTLDCGFKTPESPALRGFVGERCPITGTSLYLAFFFVLEKAAKSAGNAVIPTCPTHWSHGLQHLRHKRPTFAFTSESGYTLGFPRKIAHNGTHAETGAFRTWTLSLPSERSARSPTSPGRVSERRTLPFLGLGRGVSRRTQKAFGTAMCLCASLSRGVAAPLGCVIFFAFVEIAACMPCAQGLSVCARRGVVSLPSARFTCC